MHRATAVVFVGWAVLIATGSVHADGKFYFREEVPPNLPYQRAMLLFHDGTETLIVQSKYELSPTADVNAIGWVVPAPAVPELASIDAENAYHRFWTLSLGTQPHTWRSSDIFGSLVFLAFLTAYAWLVICVARWFLSRTFGLGKGPSPGKIRRWIFVNFAFIAFFFIVSIFTSMSGGLAREDVEVIKVQPAGIYDVTVIRGGAPDAVMDWLSAAGFHFEDSDKATFVDYVARGWCFVAAKVRAGAENQTVEGLADPLVLTFATDKPIYPLALTATAGAKTKILPYTVSDTKLTCRKRLKLRYAAPIEGQAASGLFSVRVTGPDESERPRYEPLMDIPDTTLTLCKFKGTMSAAQMARDLEFEPAADNKPYKGHEFIW